MRPITPPPPPHPATPPPPPPPPPHQVTFTTHTRLARAALVRSWATRTRASRSPALRALEPESACGVLARRGRLTAIDEAVKVRARRSPGASPVEKQGHPCPARQLCDRVGRSVLRGLSAPPRRRSMRNHHNGCHPHRSRCRNFSQPPGGRGGGPLDADLRGLAKYTAPHAVRSPLIATIRRYRSSEGSYEIQMRQIAQELFKVGVMAGPPQPRRRLALRPACPPAGPHSSRSSDGGRDVTLDATTGPHTSSPRRSERVSATNPCRHR